MGLDRQKDRSVERSETGEGTLNKGNPDRQTNNKKKYSRTIQEHTNQPTNQTTVRTTTLECKLLLLFLSSSTRRRDGDRPLWETAL